MDLFNIQFENLQLVEDREVEENKRNPEGAQAKVLDKKRRPKRRGDKEEFSGFMQAQQSEVFRLQR